MYAHFYCSLHQILIYTRKPLISNSLCSFLAVITTDYSRKSYQKSPNKHYIKLATIIAHDNYYGIEIFHNCNWLWRSPGNVVSTSMYRIYQYMDVLYTFNLVIFYLKRTPHTLCGFNTKYTCISTQLLHISTAH